MHKKWIICKLILDFELFFVTLRHILYIKVMHRIVVKVGSNVLTTDKGKLDITRLSALVDQHVAGRNYAERQPTWTLWSSDSCILP